MHRHENSSMNIFTASVLNLTKAIFLGSIIYSGLKKLGVRVKKPRKKGINWKGEGNSGLLIS